jgi:hypothetical protein
MLVFQRLETRIGERPQLIEMARKVKSESDLTVSA